MITVLIHYKKLVEAPHAMLDDYFVKKSQVIEVEKLTDLNNLFKNITKIDILQQ